MTGSGLVRAHVLIVEDEPAQRALLAYNLSAEGFRTSEAADGEAALEAIAGDPPDLVLLDWMLPRLSGIETCRRLRARAATRDLPVILLSARGEDEDKVRGLEAGADDYMVKPWSMGELVARIRAQLRRSRAAATGAALGHGDILLDPETHRVTRAGVQLRLGPTEFRLLATLMERPGRVWSREALLDRVWGRGIHVDSRTVDVHMGRLRKALMAGGGDNPVRTVRGAGYALG